MRLFEKKRRVLSDYRPNEFGRRLGHEGPPPWTTTPLIPLVELALSTVLLAWWTSGLLVRRTNDSSRHPRQPLVRFSAKKHARRRAREIAEPREKSMASRRGVVGGGRKSNVEMSRLFGSWTVHRKLDARPHALHLAMLKVSKGRERDFFKNGGKYHKTFPPKSRISGTRVLVSCQGLICASYTVQLGTSIKVTWRDICRIGQT